MNIQRNSELAVQKKFSNKIVENSEGGLNLVQLQNTIQRKFPLVLSSVIAFSSIAMLRSLTSPPIYESGFELLSEPVNIETKVTSSDDESRKTREEITSVELDTVQLKILKSPRLITRAIESLEHKYPELNYQSLTQGLTVDINTDTNNKQNILQVNYKNPNKEQVSDVIDVLRKTYIDYSVEKRQSGVKRGIEFLDRQIPRISTRAEEVEKQISTLRSKYNFTNPEDTVKRINNKIVGLAEEQEKNEIKLEQLKLTIHNLKQEFESNPIRTTTVINVGTPRYQMLSDNLKEIDVEIARKSVVFSANSPEMRTLEQERQKLLVLLIEAGEDTIQKLQNQIQSIEKRQETIKTNIASLQSELTEFSAVSADFNSLTQRLNRANNQLNEFILRKDSLLIDAAQQDAPWQLLTPAGQPKTNNLSTINYLILSSTLGLIVGMLAALILDKYQNIIYTSSQVEQLTDLPIFGVIPYHSKYHKLSFIKSVNDPIHNETSLLNLNPIKFTEQYQFDFENTLIEVFRSFAANLGLININSSLNTDTQLKSLVVTSAIPKEGKSTVAFNLAKACASMGKKVLLVDTDLRNSERLTKTLGFESKIGLKNILAEDNPKIDLNCIQELSYEENLFILTSGFDVSSSISPIIDPSRLLVSAKMDFLIEILEKRFDIIIYDLCSIIGFADVNLLAAKTDGILVVTGLGKIQTVALAEALNQLKLCQATILGIAVNKLTNKN